MESSNNPCPPAGDDPTMTAQSTATATQPHRQRPRIPHTCPEPGSLYDIMHNYAGSSLYVLPICWTDLHIKTLGVRFKQEARMMYPAPEPHRYPGNFPPSPSPEPSPAAKQLCYDVSTFVERPATPAAKIRALKKFLAGFYPKMQCKAKTTVELNMHFGTKIYRKAVKLPVMWKRADSRCHSFDSAATRPLSSSSQQSNSSQGSDSGAGSSQSSAATKWSRNAPVLGYVDRDHLAAIRKNLFRVVPGPRNGDVCNTPVASLQQLRAKMLVPADPDCDAHYIAILLAMAQARFYNKHTGRRRFKLHDPQDPPPGQRRQQQSPGAHDGNSNQGDDDGRLIQDVEVRLITYDASGKDFIVYKASIGADFLEGFARPTQRLHRRSDEGSSSSSSSSSMRISYTRLPVWPFYGFKERLGKVLGSDITGDEFGVLPGFDTFHTPEELPFYEAELERIRVDEERRYRDYQSHWREERQFQLRQFLAKSFEDEERKRKRRGDHHHHHQHPSRSLEGASGGAAATSSSPAKRRRGGGGGGGGAAAEVEVC